MTRKGRRLIEDFLLPALNDQRYGELLKWVDRDKCYFSIRWSHKNAAKWTLDDTAVFQDWDKLKGHYHPEIKGYYMQAKQRFRAALYKLNTVRKLPCEDKHVKRYQLVLDPSKRKSEILARKQARLNKKELNQKSIPTPVICKNTSYVEKPKIDFLEDIVQSPPSSPPSPASSTKSSDSSASEEYRKCFEEYQLAKQKQKQMISNNYSLHNIIKKEPIDEDEYTLPLRENPVFNGARRTPHVPIQPLPVYSSKCALKSTMDNQRRYESPHVLLVQTYNDVTDDPDQIKEEIADDAYLNNELSTTGVLNLSKKSDEFESISR